MLLFPRKQSRCHRQRKICWLAWDSRKISRQQLVAMIDLSQNPSRHKNFFSLIEMTSPCPRLRTIICSMTSYTPMFIIRPSETCLHLEQGKSSTTSQHTQILIFLDPWCLLNRCYLLSNLTLETLTLLKNSWPKYSPIREPSSVLFTFAPLLNNTVLHPIVFR